MENNDKNKKNLNFIEEIIEQSIENGQKDIYTRFPPEPNGYLHIGHAKSICLNFGLALKYNGKCNLRFDDTNPVKEEEEYVESIKEDIKWLGFKWDKELYTSDYFEQLYLWAEELIIKGKAYVDDQSQEETRLNRGTITKEGVNSPYRDRTADENLNIFRAMRQGRYKEGEKVLRAKIDMAHPNMLMRDPLMYRIINVEHHRTKNQWCIYPMYDYAHGQSDAIEKITHSICTLEFDIHRPLYDWFISELQIYSSHQYEFARLNINYTVLSKRKLLQLVEQGCVEGWDDPRMPTISGLRRRGYTPESIRLFAEKVGVTKRDNTIDLGLLEWCLREDLNKKADRRMAVLDPIKVVITNYPEQKSEILSCVNNPEDETRGRRDVSFSRELYIERDDFMEEPPKKYFRLQPGGEVRLRYAYIIKCNDVIKDSDGNIVEIHCTYDTESKNGASSDGRKVKGIIHWVDAKTAKKAQIKLFDRLFSAENPDKTTAQGSFLDNINSQSLKVVSAYVEPLLAQAKQHEKFQFERVGYFMLDKESTKDNIIFNRSVTLRDSWAKLNPNINK